jgi:hypothetical protein
VEVFSQITGTVSWETWNYFLTSQVSVPIFQVAALGRSKNLPGLTVMASMNCSFQEDVPMRIEAFALWTSLSTVFCNTKTMCWSPWNSCPKVWVREKKQRNYVLVYHHFQNTIFVITDSLYQSSPYCLIKTNLHCKANFTINKTLHAAVNCISFRVVKYSLNRS